MLELHPTQHSFAFADSHSDFHPYHHDLPAKQQEQGHHARHPHLDPFYPPLAATTAVSLPSPPSDISPSPPTLPYQPLPTPYHATATPSSAHGQQHHPATAYDSRRYSYPDAYSVSPPVTPTDDPSFTPVHPSCRDADDGRPFAFSASPSAQHSSSAFLGVRVDRRASVGAGFASLASGAEYGESSQHPQQQQYSPRPSSGYGAYPNTTDSRHPQASSSVHPRGHAPWDTAHHDVAYANSSSTGPLTTQPLPASATSASGPSSTLLAANTVSSPSAPPTITQTTTTDFVTTATGAILSHSSHTNPVQTSLPGVAVEVVGSLPTHPPVSIPPLSGPDDAPVLPLAGPGVYPSHHGRRGSAGVGQRDREGLGGLSGKDERGRDRDRDRERERDGGKDRDGKGGKNSKQYAFVELPGNAVKKRPRRRYDEIERLYQCSFPNCTKAYGTLNHLNAHVTMQKHGAKRSPAEFKELRKQWRQAKKEAEEAERERDRQENQRMLLNANGQPYGMLQSVGVPVGMGSGMGMGGHAQSQHARHPHSQSFSHAGPYALHPHQQQQQREYASMASYEMGSQQQPPQGEYEDYFLDATTQQMQQRRASVSGYPLSPASIYSNSSVGGMGVGGMNVGMGGMGVGPRGSISSIGSFDDYPASQGRHHEMEEEYPGELEYPADEHPQSQQQQWHSPGSAHVQARSMHAYSAAYSGGGMQQTREMHSPLSPHQHPHAHQQRQDEPLLASHVSLGSNRLSPNSTLLTPYIPPHHGREGNA